MYIFIYNEYKYIFFMEENLEPIKEVKNEISDNNNRSNSEEVKDAKSEKISI